MIKYPNRLPPNVAGFPTTREVPKEDFHNVVRPAVCHVEKHTGKPNYHLQPNASITSFTPGTWRKNARLTEAISWVFANKSHN